MKSIRIKLIVPFLFGSFALTLLLSWYTYNSAKRAVETAVFTVSEAKTDQVETSMALLFKSLMSNIQNIVVDPHVTTLFAEGENDGALKKTTNEWVEILTQGNDYYRDIFITDKAGLCVSSSNPGYIGKSYADMPYVKQALGGMFSINEISVGLLTKKLSSIVSGPIDTGNEIAGTIVMICDFPQLVNYKTQADGESDAIFTALMAPGGLFEAHADKSLMGNSKELFPELYDQLEKVGKQGGVVNYTLLGRSYVGYARVEPISRWVVLTSGLSTVVYAAAYRVGIVVFVISFSFLCIISFVVVRFANGILNSLLSLIDYAKHVSESQFDFPLETTDRNDELGVLHRALKRLVETLKSMLFQTQEVSRMKGEFLANMSHEIRTPINAIIGMAHLSLRDSSMTEKQRGYLEKIQIAARSLLGIINDILDLSKIEAGKLTLENTSFDLRQLVKDTLTIHQVNAFAQSLELTMDYEPGAPVFFFGDPLRIGQVLNNLLSNAIKFTKEGSVSLSCRILEKSERDALVRIGVSDTGIGISQESITKLFQPFTQADASITRQFGGTGLGLAISKNILKLMDGALDVTSVEGKGSTFSFTMRLEFATPLSGTRDREVPTEEDFRKLALKGKTILIAEDNEINQIILQELIAPSEATILLADNGQQAVDAIRENLIDLVFMDMQMPVMDGLQATRAIRAFASAAALPIIAVTANAMKEDREKVFSSGMNEYITKPVELNQLYYTLRTWLGQKAPPSAPEE